MADNQDQRPEVDEEYLRSTRIKEAVDSQCFVTWSLIEAKKREEWQQAIDGQAMYAVSNPFFYRSLQNHLRSDPDSWASKGPEYFVREVASELQKKGIAVDAIVEKHIVDFLVDREVPKSAAENFLKSFVRDIDPDSAPRSSMEAYIREEAAKRYDENSIEKGALLASTFSSGATISSILTASVNAANDNTSEKYLNLQQQESIKDVKAAHAQNVNIPKWMLDETGIARMSSASDEQLASAFNWAKANAAAYELAIGGAVSEGSRVMNIARNPISVDGAGSLSGLRSIEESEISGLMSDKGKQEISVYDATVRYRQYYAYAEALQREHSKRNYSARELARLAEQGIDDPADRDNLLKKISDFKASTGYVLDVKDGHLYYPGFLSIKNKDLQSLPDNLVVDGFIDLKGSGIKELPHDLKVKGGIYNFNGHDYPPTEATTASDGYIDLEKAGVPLAAVPATEPLCDEAPAPEAKPEAADEDKRGRQPAPNYDGWNSFADALGFSGMDDTMSHLGLTLAHLPDVLAGIFSGKSSFGFNKGTLLPLAAILLGTQSSNPILKISLIALGASSLFNKAGKETLANYRAEPEARSSQMQQQTRYRKYEDEELNPRITNPHIEGNVLVVDIDNTPRIVTLPPSVAEAYQSGAIPLNTLANRILEKTERMQQAAVEAHQDASQQYDRSQDQERGRGIR